MPLRFTAKMYILLYEKMSIYLCQKMYKQSYLLQYNELMEFMKNNKRRPSTYIMEDRNACNWLQHSQKQMSAGELNQ